ncbi:hypothetical protein AOQ65_07910 [Bacteroides fragilis]|nr:hypothetical protein BFAG_01208 [Bacteroides fragilis 3_1_12]OCL17979.1 hypothetical protein AOQ65_07910 [Bacteroides fragilis]OCM95996.1 hypothetical protein AE749_16550 [Bacteroides fragilis]
MIMWQTFYVEIRDTASNAVLIVRQAVEETASYQAAADKIILANVAFLRNRKVTIEVWDRFNQNPSIATWSKTVI